MTVSYAWWIRDQPLTLSAEKEQILRVQEVDEEGPGTVLRNLNALLSFIQEERGIRVTDKLRLLPLRALPEINARMSHPLRLGLQRPQQKSFPHIHGLYLLARASGLTRVREVARRPRLSVDEAVHSVWTHLNPTERYFTLLETWLLRARPETIGEGRPASFSIWETYGDCLSFFYRIPDGGLAVPETDAHDWLRYWPGWHNLGLLDLFGLVSVYDRPSEPGQGWHIERIEIKPFGDALMSLLGVELFSDFDNFLALSELRSVPVGTLQPVLQPYFPDWKRNLTVPEWTFREGAYVFRVSLGNLWWCRIAIPGTATLDWLATAILNAIEFSHEHLYQFSYRNQFGAFEHVNHPYMDDRPSGDDVRIGDLPLDVGQAMTYLYDFGDQWEFNVTLKRIDPVDPSIKAPVILEEGGNRPEQYRAWVSQ
jgi:hypothetical protein